MNNMLKFKSKEHLEFFNNCLAYPGIQTGTSKKVTRLAFNLFNGAVCDSDEDFENNRVSPYYAVDEIFCCGLAPYFYQAIKLRYPEYCSEEPERALWGES